VWNSVQFRADPIPGIPFRNWFNARLVIVDMFMLEFLIPELDGTGRNSWEFHRDSIPEIPGIDGTDSAMFNIAE
jgi:hypothetical protein